MACHNGSGTNDYAGPGMENPHPWQTVGCTTCHGGDGTAEDPEVAHVPPPPQLGDRAHQRGDAFAYFGRRTLAGVDGLGSYADPRPGARPTLTALAYLQFINPGDARVVRAGQSCGQCHADHRRTQALNPMVTAMGIYSQTTNAMGAARSAATNPDAQHADLAWRDWAPVPGNDTAYRRASEISGFSSSPLATSNDHLAAALPMGVDDGAVSPQRKNRVTLDSALYHLVVEQVSMDCAGCHGGSAGSNDRAGIFRSSGCTACHMPRALDGRYRGLDPHINRTEPAMPDALQPALAERSHVARHELRGVSRPLANGAFVRGMGDTVCASCHQGSNATVLQFWGIRVDDAANVALGESYPGTPSNTALVTQDPRIFAADGSNTTFGGRTAMQLVAQEDHDGDGRDDTPADIHYERGMGCVDCHGSQDVHGAQLAPALPSTMKDAVKIRCENCHGSADSFASTTRCVVQGEMQDCARDDSNSPLRHVTKDVTGNYWLVSRLTGARHYVPQVRDVVSNSNRRHPVSLRLLFNLKASWAMGRADADPSNGVGPKQADVLLATQSFSHLDNMDCTSCHAAWNNQCVGCHLRAALDDSPNNFYFSNLTGARILLRSEVNQGTYATPVPMYLGVNAKGKITQFNIGQKVFFSFRDRAQAVSRTFAFTDRGGNGNLPGLEGRSLHPALGFSALAAHTIRGKVSPTQEGPRYCVACHHTVQGLAMFGATYQAFQTAQRAGTLGTVELDLARQHVANNPGNQLNSPLWVHTVVGLGSGLFMFDANGCPVNPFDVSTRRPGCGGVSPASVYNPLQVAFDLDRLVQWTPGLPAAVSNAGALERMGHPNGNRLRAGSLNADMAGPLGTNMLHKLAATSMAQGGKVLDSWLDANGEYQGAINPAMLP